MSPIDVFRIQAAGMNRAHPVENTHRNQVAGSQGYCQRAAIRGIGCQASK